MKLGPVTLVVSDQESAIDTVLFLNLQWALDFESVSDYVFLESLGSEMMRVWKSFRLLYFWDGMLLVMGLELWVAFMICLILTFIISDFENIVCDVKRFWLFLAWCWGIPELIRMTLFGFSELNFVFLRVHCA